MTSSDPPGERYRPTFEVTVPKSLHAHAANRALKVRAPGVRVPVQPSCRLPGRRPRAPRCSAQPELPSLSQRSPGARGHRNRSDDAKTVAEEGGGPGGHSPAQTSGGRGGWQPGAFRTPLSLPLLLAAAGLLPSVWIPQTTSLLATRPGSAGSRGRRNRLQRPEPPVTPPSEHARVALAAGVGGGR